MNLNKPAFNIEGTLYYRETSRLLDSKEFSGDTREVSVINAKWGEYYTVNMKANYTDGTTAATSIIVEVNKQ